jgi:hypothetical protein
VQLPAFVVDQVRVDEPPDATVVGEALSVRVGAGVGVEVVTVTVVVVCALTPALLVHLRVYEAVDASGPTDCVPDIDLLPLHPPLAVQLVAFWEDQLRSDEPCAAIVPGVASSVTVGAGVEGGLLGAVPPPLESL